MPAAHPCSEDELQKALALSREEEEKRIKELEKRNENALFDDDFNLIDGPPNQVSESTSSGSAKNCVLPRRATHAFLQYAQQQDWQQQQQQFMQPQYTSFNPYMQAQQTGYNPFLQQQMALQQQQEAEYQRQMEMQMAAQQYQQMMTQQQMAPLQPQPTAFGSVSSAAIVHSCGSHADEATTEQPLRIPAAAATATAAATMVHASAAAASRADGRLARRHHSHAHAGASARAAAAAGIAAAPAAGPAARQDVRQVRRPGPHACERRGAGHVRQHGRASQCVSRLEALSAARGDRGRRGR
jgi:hypothetical protein